MRIEAVLIAVIGMSFVISGIFSVVSAPGQIWDNYDYDAPVNTLGKYSYLSNISTKTSNMYNLASGLSTSNNDDFFNRLLTGSYNVVMMIVDTITLPGKIFSDFCIDLGLPDFFGIYLTIIVTVFILMSFVYLVFRVYSR